MTGKPKKYGLSPELQTEIIDALEGGMTVRMWFEIQAKGRAAYKDYATEHRRNPDFAEQVEIAREFYCEGAIEDAIDTQLATGNDKNAAAAANRHAATVFRAAEMLAPKRFSPKMQHVGKDGEALTVQVMHQVTDETPGLTKDAHALSAQPHQLDAITVETTDATDK